VKRPLLWLAVISIAITAQPGLLRAWHGPTHERATRLALGSLPADALPAFFLEGAETIVDLAPAPDLARKPIAPDALSIAESPEHYFDMEHLEGAALPATRYEMLRFCCDKGLDPTQVGLAPYAIIEWTQRLTVALAEHRRWPDSPHIQAKCLIYAGTLAHYAQDLTMPLHTTIHYNGRASPEGQRTPSNIHLKLDALPAKLPADEQITVDPDALAPVDDLYDAVVAELHASHALVDHVYEIEDDLPEYDQPLNPQGPAAEFARDRLAAAAIFTARLYATAWRDSAEIELPDWLDHPAPLPTKPRGDDALASPAAHADAPAGKADEQGLSEDGADIGLPADGEPAERAVEAAPQ